MDGVDGIFGLDTDAAVRKFQEDHKDWEGKNLAVDGEVGERTADSLNREMVGIWYATYVSKDKDGTNVPESPKRPLVTHDVDQVLTLEAAVAKLAPMVVLHAFGLPSLKVPDRSVNYLPNDPGAAGSPPPDDPPRHVAKEAFLLHLHSGENLPRFSIRDTSAQPAKASQSSTPVFPEPGRFPEENGFPADKGDFPFERGQVQVCIARTIRVWRNLGLVFGAWHGNTTNPLIVTLQSREASIDTFTKKDGTEITRPSTNAFFSPPNHVNFGFKLVTPVKGSIAKGGKMQPGEKAKPPFTSDSADVVSHEVGHAILDAVAPSLITSEHTTVGAFHEAFGDISSILTALTDQDVRKEFLSGPGFDGASLVSRFAEEWGVLEFDPRDSEEDCLRNAFKENPPDSFAFNYRNPDTLPAIVDGQNFSNTVTAEIHDFGRIFVMAFFDCLRNAFKRLASDASSDDDKDEALREATAGIGKILVRAIRRAPAPVAGYYRTIARQMFLVDRDVFNQEFAPDMIGTSKGNAIVGRDLIAKDDPIIGAYLQKKISDLGLDI